MDTVSHEIDKKNENFQTEKKYKKIHQIQLYPLRPHKIVFHYRFADSKAIEKSRLELI